MSLEGLTSGPHTAADDRICRPVSIPERCGSMAVSVSASMIVRNEEDGITQALASLVPCRTRQLARELPKIASTLGLALDFKVDR